jgi:ubiquinone/menaquinone biosynthesis C-methylase UbiE
VLVRPLFQPFAQELLARLQPAKGDSLLDIACGTGIVARLTRAKLGPSAAIVAVDLAPPMLAVARGADSSIDWREGNATSLPVKDGERFTMITCHQGMQFIPDKPAAVREMKRVLTQQGRLAVATWCSLSDFPAGRELNEVVERHVGPIADSRHSFGDANALKALLTDGGFRDVRVDRFAHDVRFDDGTLFARLNAMAAIGMTEKGKALSDGDRAALAGQIAAESQPVIARYSKDGKFVFSLPTNIAVGRC